MLNNFGSSVSYHWNKLDQTWSFIYHFNLTKYLWACIFSIVGSWDLSPGFQKQYGRHVGMVSGRSKLRVWWYTGYDDSKPWHRHLKELYWLITNDIRNNFQLACFHFQWRQVKMQHRWLCECQRWEVYKKKLRICRLCANEKQISDCFMLRGSHHGYAYGQCNAKWKRQTAACSQLNMI